VSWRELVGKYIYAMIADYVPVVVIRGINSKCVFLKYVNNTPTCTIYPARPMRCRLYPFLPIAPGETSRLEISSKCPGVGRGEYEDPPWSDLEAYLGEVKDHYRKLYDLIFTRNLEPVKALERALDEACFEKHVTKLS
jgi:Fe-S-cluster containining protein